MHGGVDSARAFRHRRGAAVRWCIPRRADGGCQTSQKTIHVRVKVRVVPNLGPIPEGEVGKRVRKIRRPRHRGAIHGKWDDRNLTPQSGLNLEANEVGRLVESSLASLINIGHPPPSDDHKDDVALGNHAIDVHPKVNAKGDGVDIEEHIVGAEVSCKAIPNASSDRDRVRTAVGNKHAGLSVPGSHRAKS
jgi:hypothetical protein